jgi:hypothetical protein
MNSITENPQNTIIKLDDLAININSEHTEAIQAARQSLMHAIRAGDLLLQAKAQVGHGAWLDWVKDNCQFSDRTARAYMRLAENQNLLPANWQTSADLSIDGALELLAGPEIKIDDKFPGVNSGAVIALFKNWEERLAKAQNIPEMLALEREVGEAYFHYKVKWILSSRELGKWVLELEKANPKKAQKFFYEIEFNRQHLEDIKFLASIPKADLLHYFSEIENDKSELTLRRTVFEFRHGLYGGER